MQRMRTLRTPLRPLRSTMVDARRFGGFFYAFASHGCTFTGPMACKGGHGPKRSARRPARPDGRRGGFFGGQHADVRQALRADQTGGMMIINFETHASNERTFLAWVRTVVAIVGFGLAAARLGNDPQPHWSEIPMLCAGAAVILIAWLRMRHVRKRIDDPARLPDDSAPAELFLLLLIVALFVLLGSFLFHVS